MFAGLFSSNSAKDNASNQTNPQRRLSSATATKPPVIIHKPPFPHPLPHTKIQVEWTTDGLLLSGLRSKNSTYSARKVLVSYGKAARTSTLEDTDTLQKNGIPYTCHGCLGVLRLYQESYVLLITSRRYVGKYAGVHTKRIFCLTGVTAIPVSTPSAAKEVLQNLSAAAHPVDKRCESGNSSGDSDSSSTSDDAATSSSESHSSQDDLTVEFSTSPQTSHQKLEQVPQKLDERVSMNTARQIHTSGAEPQIEGAEIGEPEHVEEVQSSKAGLGRFFWPYRGRRQQEEVNELVDCAEAAVQPVAPDSKPITGGSTPDHPPSGVSQAGPDLEKLRAFDKKVLRELLAELTGGGFFFSYDFDLTTCMQTKWQALMQEQRSVHKTKDVHHGESTSATGHVSGNVPSSKADLRRDEPRISEPLSQRADRRFWYNRWLSKDLLDAGAYQFATVLMQGYVQRRQVLLQPAQSDAGSSLANNSPKSAEQAISVEMLIISRRSIERPGLRYQRRGVNDAGGVANFVETEFIMSACIDNKEHLTSYVQTRGSIPLYWSQSPWSLKPVPVLEREQADNQKALGKHFERQIKTYFGAVHIVNLAEISGKEGLLVSAYRNAVEKLGRPEVIYNEWDFHHMCRGMRYERISQLLDQLAPQIDHMASFWLMDGEILANQRGVMRINCMDCLDRTNVVESAFARGHVISVLEHLGVHNLASASREALDVAFNELWANNGDAISREYAGTSALKGDFVRSGKRNWLGQLNDATNSVARFWQNTVLDFFKQAMIDYVLGINTNAFVEFTEKMQASDPGEITRLTSIRQAAIGTAASAVLADDERKLHGWTLISPATFGQIRDTAYEEKILFLTSKALYACSFEYTLQKVREFVRIPLGQIVGIRQGEYILSALDPAARNIEENYGFCIRYLQAGVEERSRTYSIRNTTSGGSAPAEPADLAHAADDDILELAFKAVRKDLVRDLDHVASLPSTVTSRVQVLDIVDNIRQACEEVGATTPEDSSFVEETPIISLAQAKSQVSLLDRLNYELKNMIWL